jgi:Protein of unknown function (DUF2442)
MIPRVVEVTALKDYRLQVLFQDSTSRTVDLSSELWGPMFEPLRDKTLFARAIVHPELHTVMWPNGADLSPEFLYKAAQQSVAADVPQAARR